MKISDKLLEIGIVAALEGFRNSEIIARRQVRTASGMEWQADHIAFYSSLSDGLSAEIEMDVKILNTGGQSTFFIGKRQININTPRWLVEKEKEMVEKYK